MVHDVHIAFIKRTLCAGAGNPWTAPVQQDLLVRFGGRFGKLQDDALRCLRG